MISQAINRASVLNRVDRPAEALESFTVLDRDLSDHASSYGKMWIWSGMVCAAHDLGEDTIAEEQMARVREEFDANPSAATVAAGCLGDIDSLEQLYVKRLDDPEMRNGALGLYVDTPDRRRSKFEQRMHEVSQEVMELPSIKERLKKYGRRLKFDGIS